MFLNNGFIIALLIIFAVFLILSILLKKTGYIFSILQLPVVAALVILTLTNRASIQELVVLISALLLAMFVSYFVRWRVLK